MPRTYWQVSAGSAGRNYCSFFLEHGMAFVGGEKNKKELAEVKSGDVIILKEGLSQIIAAGVVVDRDGKYKGEGDCDWLKDFDGWNLSAYCFVDWHKPPNPKEVKGLTITTIQRTHREEHKRIAEEILKDYPTLPVLPQPKSVDDLNDEEILKYLITLGLRPASAEDLLTAFRRIRLLSEYYYNNCKWEQVRENEVRAFLVVPLLLSLGWAEQQLKLEFPCYTTRGKVDIACFRQPWIDGAARPDCKMLIETKGFSSGLTYAPAQAKAYAADFPECKTLIVSNGYCYKAYLKQDSGDFTEKPTAYLNLIRPKQRYPLDPKIDGGLVIFKLLLPFAE